MTDDITQEELHRLIIYEKDSGCFIWRPRPSVRCSKRFEGKVAGGHESNGYIQIYMKGKLRMSHRLAWLYTYGHWPIDQIDHINGIRDDNRICNLREVNNQQNQMNAKKRFDNTSGKTGVCYFSRDNNWRSTIVFKGKSHHLGYFETKEEAILAREEAEVRFGFSERHGK